MGTMMSKHKRTIVAQLMRMLTVWLLHYLALRLGHRVMGRKALLSHARLSEIMGRQCDVWQLFLKHDIGR